MSCLAYSSSVSLWFSVETVQHRHLCGDLNTAKGNDSGSNGGSGMWAAKIAYAHQPTFTQRAKKHRAHRAYGIVNMLQAGSPCAVRIELEMRRAGECLRQTLTNVMNNAGARALCLADAVRGYCICAVGKGFLFLSPHMQQTANVLYLPRHFIRFNTHARLAMVMVFRDAEIRWIASYFVCTRKNWLLNLFCLSVSFCICPSVGWCCGCCCCQWFAKPYAITLSVMDL